MKINVKHVHIIFIQFTQPNQRPLIQYVHYLKKKSERLLF